ncbi:MAG: DEAD/DEAH box helicase [Oscillospiraceae bacterium]
MGAEDYLSLPPRIDDIRYVKLDAKAQKQYEQMERDMLLTIDESTIDAGTAAVLSNKLLQLCNGAMYDENGATVEIHDCKLEAFTELVEALNGKTALVFYNFKHDLVRIKRELSKMHLRIGELKTPEDISNWNEGKVDILLAHPASAAYGLNLQDGGSHIIWYGLNWSLELYQQANARLHRQGQKDKVFIHHLVTEGCMDQTVMEALEGKCETQDTLLNALKAKIKKIKQES